MSYFLVLDDQRSISDIKFPVPPQNPVLVKNFEEFCKIITERGLPTHVSFDFDLSVASYRESARHNFKGFDFSNFHDKNGLHCAEFLIKYCLEKQVRLPKWYIHSANLYGRELIRKLLNKYGN